MLFQLRSGQRHVLGNDKVAGYIEAGEHRLLIRAEQGRGRFDFSINICEPIDDLRYAGNRYPGVRYYQSDSDSPLGEMQVRAKQSWDPWRMGRVESNLPGEYDPVIGYHEAPDSVLIATPPAATVDLLEVLATQFPDMRVGALTDTVTTTGLSRMPFWMAHMGFGKEGWPPEQRIELGRLMGWAGLAYWVSIANGEIESAKAITGWLAQGRIPLTGYDEGWGQLNGYRKDGRGARVHSVRPDTAEWHDYGRGTWGRLPGRDWLETPVLVAQPAARPLSADAWIDTAAAVALEFARRTRTEYEEDWGTRGCPAGLAAWDALVTDWERLPWTTEWARTEGQRDLLGRIRNHYKMLSEERAMAGRLFERASQWAQGDRQQHLQTAAQGYATATRALLAVHDGLPESRTGDISAQDSLRLQNISSLKPLMRQARTGERAALEALRTLTGAPALPPALEDPLQRRDEGRVLFHWQASLSKGVYNLVLSGKQLSRSTLRGRDTEGEQLNVENAVRRKSGWQLALEVRAGGGLYHVVQLPSKDNDWTAILRIDDEWTQFDNATDIALWEVPSP